MTSSMESLCKKIKTELDYVKKRYSERRNLEAGDSEVVMECYQRIQGCLQRLTFNTNITMWKIVDEHASEARLDRLSPAFAACYNSTKSLGLKRGPCTEDTRVEVLHSMNSWVYSGPAGATYWLTGMAGTGKTTISYSLCKGLDDAHRLGASFFCSRVLPECRDVNRIIPSIAYQLALFSRPFQCALLQILDKDRDIHTRQLELQFGALIVKPLQEVETTLPTDLVVIIDALDECDDKESTGLILEVLLTKAWDLPIKFFVSSRAEPEIRDQMVKQGGDRASERLVLHELDKGTVQADIATYLRVALAPVYPLESQLTELVERAGVLFIYAATVVRYIGYNNFRRNPRARLETVLTKSKSTGSNVNKEIDELYATIMRVALDDPGLEDAEREDVRQILYAVICSQEPLTINALSGLLGLHDADRAHAAIRPLWSVLHVGTNEVVTTLHASFPDFLLDSNRSKEYFCDSMAYNYTLAHRCFECIKNAQPQFNICGLESSHVADKSINDFDERVEKAVSIELFYASRYWAAHLDSSNSSSALIDQLREFLSTRFLLWMEIMNLKKSIQAGIIVMQLVEIWSMRQECPPELRELVLDAWRFITTFASNPVSKSTPHIYVSMLPFWPHSSPIARHYTIRAKYLVTPEGTATTQQPVLLAAWCLGGAGSSVSFSPDGARIALGRGGCIEVLDAFTGAIVLGPLDGYTNHASSVLFSPEGTRPMDLTLRLRDARTGEIILGPLQRHVGSTIEADSIGFSPDGTRIAAGFYDGAICVWDQSGQIVHELLEGHSSGVPSVSFSSDSALIVSGSLDQAICVWDARSGQVILGPFQGHTDSVKSVMFSPDSTRIVSGSDDATVCVWDAQSGQLILGPFTEHYSDVTSVAFSPDGTLILSSSGDATIYVRDAQNGQIILGPLEKHSLTASSAAFSPDGTRIVSAGYGATVCVWDARRQQTPSESFNGHTSRITSVQFSPDGTRIASSSTDSTICVWDAQSGRRLLGPIEGHDAWVLSIAFSPDGLNIISGSYDTTVCVWDAYNGRLILGPLEEHTASVTSVAFSPDGSNIISGSYGGTIYVRDAQGGKVVAGPIIGGKGTVHAAMLSPDSSHIIAICGDSLYVWDHQGNQLLTRPFDYKKRAKFSAGLSPCGTRVATCWDYSSICVWDVENGSRVLGPSEGHFNSTYALEFSPCGNFIVSGSNNDTVCVWDARSGERLFGPLQGHIDTVEAVGVSPDGTRVVSGSLDKTIRVWDIQSRAVEAPPDSTVTKYDNWTMDKNGWIIDDMSRLLIWVPQHLRTPLMRPKNTVLISSDGYVRLNFDNALIGDSWAGCYHSA